MAKRAGINGLDLLVEKATDSLRFILNTEKLKDLKKNEQLLEKGQRVVILSFAKLWLRDPSEDELPRRHCRVARALYLHFLLSSAAALWKQLINYMKFLTTINLSVSLST